MLGLVFYRTAQGNRPVQAYLEDLDPASRAVVLEKIQAFCEEFPEVRTVSLKPVRGKVWEIRVGDRRGREHRLLYAVVGSDLVIVHAFVKKTRRTPPGDIGLAERRLREMTTPAVRGRRR